MQAEGWCRDSESESPGSLDRWHYCNTRESQMARITTHTTPEQKAFEKDWARKCVGPVNTRSGESVIFARLSHLSLLLSILSCSHVFISKGEIFIRRGLNHFIQTSFWLSFLTMCTFLNFDLFGKDTCALWREVYEFWIPEMKRGLVAKYSIWQKKKLDCSFIVSIEINFNPFIC